MNGPFPGDSGTAPERPGPRPWRHVQPLPRRQGIL